MYANKKLIKELFIDKYICIASSNSNNEMAYNSFYVASIVQSMVSH